MPDNFAPADPNNPYADYSVQRMYDYLSAHELARAPGETVEYSNLAVGLLGHILAEESQHLGQVAYIRGMSRGFDG